MKFIYQKNSIKINDKVITKLDEFVFDFIKILKNYSNYVIVCGYIPILFGRTRGTEDIDILIERIDKKTFDKIFENLNKDYWYLNPEDKDGLFEMLNEGLGIRIAKKGEIIPNIELKFVKNKFDLISINNSVRCTINENITINISPLELQIPFKFYLGSEKDIEDGLYLYMLFKDEKYFSIDDFKKYLKNLNVDIKKLTAYGIKL